jgi:ubiquinone/menaquinone biosynthesis C-methylase UbiE
MSKILNEVARKYSTLYPVMNDSDRRRNRGMKIAAILKEALGNRKVISIVDLGCSNALVLDTVVDEIGPDFALGIDMDSLAMPPPSLKRSVLIGDATQLPLASGSVDVVICNHTYEHVPDSQKLFSEIYRVLSAEGLVYFSAMNATWPIEPHYHLPFVHWLPSTFAQRILAKRGYPSGYQEKPLSKAKLVKLVAAFEIDDYTIKVIANPKKYHAESIVKAPFLGGIYKVIARTFYRFLPGYLWVLKKKPGK